MVCPRYIDQIDLLCDLRRVLAAGDRKPNHPAPGVIGKLGTIKRSGGETQVTYDRHPLYTYVGDSAPGQAKGNNINLNGGLWHEMTVSG